MLDSLGVCYVNKGFQLNLREGEVLKKWMENKKQYKADFGAECALEVARWWIAC